MKKLLLIFLLPFAVLAQVTPGPTDTVTARPLKAAANLKLICTGSLISLKASDTETGLTFTWYKINMAGISEQSPVKGSAYTEMSTTPGYYKYQVQAKNVAGCIALSDIFNVYVSNLAIPLIK